MAKLSTIFSDRKLKWLWFGAGLVAAFSLFGSASKNLTTNDQTAFLPKSAQSTQVVQIQKQLPGSDSVAAIVVYERGSGVLNRVDKSKISSDVTALRSIKTAESVVPTNFSADGHAALVTVSFPSNPTPASAIKDARSITSSHLPSGLTAAVSGPAGFIVDEINAFSGLSGKLLLASIAVVAILLLLTYRSPWLWLVPLFVVGMADQAAGGIVNLVAQHTGLTLNGENTGILRVLVFGAGTDYALLLIARYREELHNYKDKHEAMAHALRTAGPAILASAATVILALLALVVSTLNSDRTLGPVGAIGIACAFLFSTVMLPAMLLLFGRGIFWPRVPKFGQPAKVGGAFFGSIGRTVRRYPVVLGGACLLILVGLSTGLHGLKLGLPASSTLRTVTQSTTGEEAISRHFAAGATAPLNVVTRPAQLPAVEQALRGDSHVSLVIPGSSNTSYAQLTVITTDTPDSQASFDTIRRLRTATGQISGADALIGGQTAASLDTNDAATHDRELVIPLILLIVFVMLAILLRSLAAPFWLVVSVVISFLAALGYSNVLYAWLVGTTAVDQSVPLLGFVFLVALGVDYNIFLMTRAAEETPERGLKTGTIHALVTTGGVITSAGLVLAATFAVLAVLPLTILAQIGVLVSVGVLLDTILVRTIIVPSLAVKLGRGFWWPRFRTMKPEK